VLGRTVDIATTPGGRRSGQREQLANVAVDRVVWQLQDREQLVDQIDPNLLVRGGRQPPHHSVTDVTGQHRRLLSLVDAVDIGDQAGDQAQRTGAVRRDEAFVQALFHAGGGLHSGEPSPTWAALNVIRCAS